MSTTSIRGGADRSRLRPVWLRTVAITAALVVGITGTVVASNQPAWADDYATWADVNAARNDVAAAEALIRTIEAQLASLKANAERTAQDAADKSNIWMEADQKFQAAASRADTLQAQADEANALAVVSERRAGQMAAQMMRSGSQDVTTNLLLNAGEADDLLYGLGMSGKITVQADSIFARAIFDQNTAQAQTDAADIAKTELEALKIAAEAAFVEAQAASLAAAAALEEQLNRQNELNQQLVVLREKRTATEADYLAGVRERYARASLEAGQISDSGWVQPARGYISSTYGGRDLRGSYNFHTGTDIANACGTNIFAASSGTVTISTGGWNGGYGNYIVIDHGNGISTAYGHILDGGRLVSAGERVDVGQNIAKVGTTGNSTGCHLHFEVRSNGRSQDAQPYMRAQGVPLG
jgi:murein DD-endopeptidase MepM/ murein hydrolase activator NlpD